MKVIQELVAYFERRGRLGPAAIHRLLEQGFLAADAPRYMIELAEPVGATYYFRVTGAPDGPLWGTDIYTGDSALATAVVHAGLVRAGEQTVVRVATVPPPAQFQGSTRHGITSHDFGRYGSAYRVCAVGS